MSGGRDALENAESGFQDCPELERCNAVSDCTLNLSQIPPGASRRGSRDPKILLVTEAPDEASSEGTAYQGSTSTRMQNFFCREDYGIGLDKDDSDSFSEFLQENRIYATSAVKCCIAKGSASDVGSYVIDTCSEKYLENQIEAMPNLELIIPMGVVATAAVLRTNPDDLQLTSILGRQNHGVFQNYDDWGADVVVLPHPSGMSPLSNPPVVDGEGSKSRWRNVESFRRALGEIRDRLGSMGYDVLDGNPTCWDSPDGLSRF